jgi:hypothetical protein
MAKDIKRKEYDEETVRFDFLIKSFKGGSNLVMDNKLNYITRYPLESVDRWNARKKRISVLNFFEYMVSIYTNAIFSQEINTSGVQNEKLKRFINNATLKGKTLVSFLRTVSIFSTFLNVAVIVDSYSDDKKRRILKRDDVSKATIDEINRYRLYPYVQMVFPDKIIDKYIDDTGVLQWIKLGFKYTDKSDPLNGDYEEAEKRILWTAEYVSEGLIDSKGELTWGEKRPHNLGCVPVILFSQTADDETDTWLNKWEDIAKLQKMITNWLSLIDEEFHYLVFSFLAVERSDDTDNEDVKDALNNPGDGKNLVEFTANPPVWVQKQPQTEIIISAMTEIIRFMKSLTSLDVDDEQSVFAKSGKAKELSRQELEETIKNKSDGLENLADRILSIVAKYESATIGTDEKISMPDRFDSNSVMDKLNTYILILNQNISGLLNKYVRKKVIDLADPDLEKKDPELHKQMEDEIDKSNWSIPQKTISDPGTRT